MQNKLIHGLASLLLPLGLYGATPSNNAGTYYRPNLRVSASRLTSPISGQPQLSAFADVLDLSGIGPSAEHSLLAADESELTLFTPTNELLIIDAAVPDRHLLLENLKPGVDVQVIAGDADGLEQLERILSTRKNISALHIVSHASDGVLQLGNTVVTRELLRDRLTVLATLDKALVDGADLLLYGCDLAETERGEALLELIANESHVDVAASNDLTGNAALGGDWDLEIVLGDIETERAFTDRALMDFSAILQTAFEFDTLGVSGGTYKAAYDTTIGGGLQSWVSVSDTFSYVATNYMYWDAPGSGATMYLVPDGVTYTKWDVSAINLFSLTGGNVTIDSTSYVVFSVDGGAPVTRNFSGDQVLTTASTDMFSFFTDGTAITNVTSVKMVLTMDAGSLDTNINRLGFKSITLQASGGGGGGGGGNNAPVADLNGGGAGIDNTASFTEGGGAVDISPAATVTDLDTDTITTITIALTNDQDGVVEGLNVTAAAQNALTGVAGATDITLQDTISIAGATASVAEVQTFLRSVTYNNTASPPNTTNRNITVTINDGTENNNPVPAVTMSVSAAAPPPPPPPPNTPPVVDLDMGGPPGDTTASFTQGGGPVKIAPSAGVADLDLDTIKTITVTLTNNQDGASEGLNVTGAAQNALTGVAGATDIVLQNTITIAGATATLAEVQTFLQAITYNNTATPPTTTARTITVVVNDGTNPSNTATTTMSVAAAGATLPPDYCEPPLRFENGLCVASELPTINSVSFDPGTYTEGATVPVTILMNPLSAQLPGGLSISGTIANLAVSGLNYLGGNSFSAVFKVTKTGNPGARNYAGAADIPVNLILSDVSARSNAFRSVITGVPNDVISFCPANASVSDLDLDKNGQFDDCKCDTGYRFNSDKTICEVYPQGIVLSESSLTLLEGGESASFTVTVEEDATDQTAIGTATASAGLEILAGETGPLSNTDSSYTVIFRATDNDLKDGDRSGLIIISGMIDGQTYSETLEVSIEDDEIVRLSASPTELTVVEGETIRTTLTATGLGEGDFVEVTVKLADPAQESLFQNRVGTIALGANNSSVTLPFFPADNDIVDAGNTATFNLSAKLTNESDPFNTQDLGEFASITVNITNDDLPDFSVSKSPIELNEGATDTFTVDLFSDVPAGVSFTVTNSDSNRATITPETFELTKAATNQTLTVSTAENLIDDPSTPVTFTITPTYNEKELASKKVELNINDDDQAGVVLFHDGSVADPSTPLQLVEGGASRSFEIVLRSQPVSDVTVDFANGPFIGFSEGETPYSVTPSSLTFTADNWNTRQRVTASAPDNSDVRGDTTYNFNIALRSEDAVYKALTVARRVVKVLEDDKAGLIVTQNGQAPDASAELILEEGKSGQNYEFALSARPIADVTVSFQDSTGRVVFNPTTLVFTPENYGTAQTLTLLALDDSIDQDDTVSATLGIAMSSTDSNFNQSIAEAATVKVADNDVAGLAVTQDGTPLSSESASFQFVEGEDSLVFEVALSSQPASTVTIEIGEAIGQLQISNGLLSFTPDNWTQSQSLQIGATDDKLFEELNSTANVEITVLSSDPRYAAFSGASVPVTVVDNDRPVIASISLRSSGEGSGFVIGESVVADLTINPANVNFSTLDLTGTIGGIAVKDFKHQSAGNYTAVFDIPVPESSASCTNSNSALITGVTVTSGDISPYPDSDADKAVDGSGLTDCVHDKTLSNSAVLYDRGPHTMTFDLGSVKQVNSFRLWNLFAQNKEGEGVKQVTAYLSDDGNSFTQDDVFTFEQEANGQGSEFSVGWTTRYIRFEFQSTQTQDAIDHHTEYGISEIQFFGGASSDSDSDSTSVGQNTDIAASDSIPVNLSLSSEGTAYATYTQSIVGANDAILTTPATVSLALNSAAVEGVEEGQSTNVSVTVVDAFGNPWPRALTIPLSYAGSEASRDGGQFVALTEDQFDSVNGVMVPGGEAGANEANATELGEIGGATKVEVTGYSLSRYQEVRKPDVYSFTATDTATYSLSAQTSIGDRGFTIYPAGSDGSSDNHILNFLTDYGQPTRDYKTFNLTAGETYIISLLGYDGSGTYSFSLGIADFSAPDSVEIAASAGEATATIDIRNDQSTEPGSSGNGETIIMKVDSAKLPDTAVAGANGTATIRIIDVQVPRILSVSIPDQVHVLGDEVTATITVESNPADYTAGEGGISGTIGGIEVAGLTRVSDTQYQTTFTVPSSAAFSRAESDTTTYFNGFAQEIFAGNDNPRLTADISANTQIDGYHKTGTGESAFYDLTALESGTYTLSLSTEDVERAKFLTVHVAGDKDYWNPEISRYEGPRLEVGGSSPAQAQLTAELKAGQNLAFSVSGSGFDGGYTLQIYSGSEFVSEDPDDIAAASDIPVNLTLTSDKGAAGTAYTGPISQDNDALLTTPAAVNISLDETASEGSTVTGTVTALDAFGNAWPRSIIIPLSYTGSTAEKDADFTGPDAVSKVFLTNDGINFPIALLSDNVTDPNETVVVAVDTDQLASTARAGSNASATLTITDVTPYVLKLTLDNNSLLDSDSGRIGVLSVQGYEGDAVYSRLSAADSNGVCADNGDDFNSSFLPKADATLELLDKFADFGTGLSPIPDEARFCLQATIGSGEEATSVVGAFVLDVYTTPVLTFTQTWTGLDVTPTSTPPSTVIVMRDSMIRDPDFDGNGIPRPVPPIMGNFEMSGSSLDERLQFARVEFVEPADSRRNNCTTASSMATVNAVFTGGLFDGKWLHTPANIDLKESPANFDACVRMVLNDAAQSVAVEFERIFTVRTVFELEREIELSELASSFGVDSNKVSFNSLSGVLTVDLGGGSQASCTPLGVEDAPAGAVAGAKVNGDGVLEIVTAAGKLLTCAGSVADVEKLKNAVLNFQNAFPAQNVPSNQVVTVQQFPAGNLAAKALTQSSQSLIPIPPPGVDLPRDQVEEDAFALKVGGARSNRALGSSSEQGVIATFSMLSASIYTQEVGEELEPGLVVQPSSASAGINTYYFVYDDESGIRRSQEILPETLSWRDVRQTIELIDGVSAVSKGSNGAISIVYNGATVRVLPDYQLRAFENFDIDVTEGGISFELVEDMNGDGIEDIDVIYPQGVRQYLYQLPN